MDRSEIEALKVGDVVKRSLDGKSWGKAERVVKITFRGVSVKGAAFVGGETAWSDGATMTFSISEGERYLTLTNEEPAVAATTWHYGAQS